MKAVKIMAPANVSAEANAYVRTIMEDAETTAAPSFALGRRGFIKLSVAGGGLALAFTLGMPKGVAAATEKAKKLTVMNAYVRIAPDNTVTLLSRGPEIGQGIKTAFGLILAEELDADWASVTMEQAPVDSKIYGDQSAGGSRSIPKSWDVLRQAGAAARAMLIAAAAQQWKVPDSECTALSNMVMHQASGKKLSYGQLADAAAKMPVPDVKTLKLKERKDYKLYGKRYTGVDNLKVVTGKPLFGIDQAPKGVLYANYTKCPAAGGKVISFNADEIKKMPGVKDAFAMDGNGKFTEVMPGVAIIATSTWAALQAKKALKVVWDESAAAKDSTTANAAKAAEIAKQEPKEIVTSVGDVNAQFKSAPKTVEAFYSYPFVSHAQLEPQVTTAHWQGDKIELWSSTQNATAGRKLVAGVVGVPEEMVTIHQTRVGGGFGRRLMNDYMCEAAAISQRVNGPVKLQWTREDDMQHDFYRVQGFHQFKGAVDKNGKLTAWNDHFISFAGLDGKPVAGGNMPPDEFPINVLPHVHVAQTLMPVGVPCGPWRAPRSNGIAFAVQSFMHEMAVAAGRDHLEFLVEVMGERRWIKEGDQAALNTGRAIDVIKLAGEKAGWGKPLPKGRGMGLAFHFSHLGHFAEVVDLSVDEKKKITVHKIVVAGDIGPIINMSGAESQCQGAALDGLSTALGLEITIENGRIQQSNFGEYQALRMPQACPVEAHFIQSEFSPTGVGEPALPPVAPAVVNAIFAATGVRVRSLPLAKFGYTI